MSPVQFIIVASFGLPAMFCMACGAYGLAKSYRMARDNEPDSNKISLSVLVAFLFMITSALLFAFGSKLSQWIG